MKNVQKFHNSGQKNVEMSGFVNLSHILLIKHLEFFWNDLHGYKKIWLLQGIHKIGPIDKDLDLDIYLWNSHH